ncbi:hypothetical protein L6164_016950 [Bauhinia variegata]|uniref:Uncharacterized protein n=1 Tax=Bauhinia variegata TaxID=167791 RepID=A0ACB9N651_BAUVA|nr:hypothetical protein L6164_016950 [Bauhinia variegata]
MASLKQALTLFFPFFLTFSSTVNSQIEEAGIHVYWGQNVSEGTLQETCQSGSYKYVSLTSLTQFGCNTTPSWDFDGHCSGWECFAELAPEIKYCQSKNVSVFLSIGGMGNDSLCSPEDAKEVANYLWHFFLSDQFGLGLDGVVFDVEGDTTSNLYWDDLVRDLSAFKEKKKLYFIAVPGCVIPDEHLDEAINTGCFDIVAPKFYNNSVCQFDGSTDKLLSSWDNWTSYVPSNASLFMTITTNPSDSGYICPTILSQRVLPYIRETDKYAGISVWNRYWDMQLVPSYSDQILPYIQKDVLRFITEIQHVAPFPPESSPAAACWLASCYDSYQSYVLSE